jgi:glycerol dehydrogenase
MPDADPSLPEHCPPLVPMRGAAQRLAADMQALGLRDPVLVLADDAAIAGLAPAWAESFATLGWLHRVMACGENADSRMIAAIVAEAAALAARTIVGAGDGRVLDAAREAATAARLPFVACPNEPPLIASS